MSQHSRLVAFLRLARIAFSAVFAAVFLVVIFCWVRSYSYSDGGMLKILPKQYIQFHAGDGRMCVWFEHKPIDRWADWWSSPIRTNTPPDAENRIPSFNLVFWPTFARLYLAHWLLAVTAAALAALPWCPRRFGLRGFIIVVTVIALLAALILWIDRSF